MRAFKRFALVSTIASYLLIFTGGLVRVCGAGLGCPDWPKCFGRWLPPFSASQLPADIDQSAFNLALAWIEYSNRLLGMALGLLVVVTALLAIKYHRQVARIIYPTLAAALLVAIEGWQGGKVVTSQLQPLFVSLHLLIALGIVLLLTYVTWQAYYIEHHEDAGEGAYPKRARLWIAFLGALAIAQVILGTQVRSALEILTGQYPLATDLELIAKLDYLKYLHPALGAMLAIITLAIGYQVLRLSTHESVLIRYGVWSSALLLVCQLALGMGLIGVGTPPLLQVFHLWAAALYVGTILVLYLAVREGRQSQ